MLTAIVLSLALFIFKRLDWRYHLIFGIAAIVAAVGFHIATMVTEAGMKCYINQTQPNVTVQICEPIYKPNPYTAFTWIVLMLGIIHVVYACWLIVMRWGTYLVEESLRM